MNLQKNKPVSGLQKALHKILWVLVYALPALLFFSYYPIISFGSNSSMNFELSLPLLWLVLFDAVAFLSLILFALARGSKSGRSFSEPSRECETRATERGPRKDGRPNGMKKSLRTDLLGLSDRRFFLFSLFPFYATLSIFWSANPVRAILTAGIIWLLFFAIFAIIYVLPLLSPPQAFKKHLLATFFVSTALVCLFCFIQSILDACGFSRENTLLCAGCTSYSFGFPHPSGFAIEPQFMGNLLLAPTLTALYLIAFHPEWQKTGRNGASNHVSSVKRLSATGGKRVLERIESGSFLSESSREREARATERGPRKDGRPNGMKKRKNWILCILACLFSTTLFFTFSRGAIYAYAIALAILLIFALVKHRFRWALITIPVCTFLLTLSLQGAFSALGPTSETFMGGVTKSLHQLSLGRIDLRSLAKAPESSQESSATSQDPSKTPSLSPSDAPEAPSNHNPDTDSSSGLNPSETASEGPESSIFEGYVAESTNVRLNLNRSALQTWLNAPDRTRLDLNIGCVRWLNSDPPNCLMNTTFTPTSVLFGVGLGGAGTALYLNRDVTYIGSPKEIVQNQFFSLLLELGLVGIALAIFSLLLAFSPNLFPKKFLDGRAATLEPCSTTPKTPKTLPASAPKAKTKSAAVNSSNPFFQNPALPLLVALIVAYLITLNFFSGLPNALHIYLLPPLLFFTFSRPTVNTA